MTDDAPDGQPAVERMHGYEAGTARSTTELELSRKHPEDCGQVAATRDEVRRTATAFSTRHRIDLTPPRAPRSREQQNRVSEAVAEISEARSGTGQAKGMLMLICRIGEDAASSQRV